MFLPIMACETYRSSVLPTPFPVDKGVDSRETPVNRFDAAEVPCGHQATFYGVAPWPTVRVPGWTRLIPPRYEVCLLLNLS